MTFNFKCTIAYIFILHFKTNSFICITTTLQNHARPCKIRNKENILYFIFYVLFLFLSFI